MSGQMGRVLVGLVGAATAAVLMVPGAAFAKGPGGGGGGGGGGSPGEETVSHSLSVPTVFVGGSNPFGLTCDGSAKEPTGDPQTGFPVDGSAYFYVQGVNTWQAGCLQGEGYGSATANVAWGDNLAGDAKLKVGMPIRVEIGLFVNNTVMTDLPALTGWDVLKLEPDKLDREALYGTRAVADPSTGLFSSVPQTPYPEMRVWAAGATLTITKVGATTPVVDHQPAGAEVNATGRVVYGYNLRVSELGQYVIAYHFPGVTLSGTDVGSVDASTATLIVSVGSGGGGGGGRPTR